MYIILNYNGRIISLTAATTTPECIQYFINQDATILEYRDWR